MSNKTLIITGFTDSLRDQNETDNKMEEVFELTLPSKEKYARKHGYDILTIRSFPGIDNVFCQKQIGFLRALKVFEMLNYYDNVMWLDADAIITNNIFDINYFTEKKDKILYVSYDWNNFSTINSGNFVIKNHIKIQQFCSIFLSIAKNIIENKIWGGEQTTFNIMNTKTEMSNFINVLDHSYLNSVPTCLGWEENRKIVNPWTPECFLAHLTGDFNKKRIDVLKNNFKKYL